LRNVGVLRTRDGRGSPRREPCFDFAQIPYDASWREREASRELAALFHLVDRAVGERDHFPQLMPPYRALDRFLAFRRHDESPFGSEWKPMKAIVAER
jgi:hypothetical protein